MPGGMAPSPGSGAPAAPTPDAMPPTPGSSTVGALASPSVAPSAVVPVSLPVPTAIPGRSTLPPALSIASPGIS